MDPHSAAWVVPWIRWDHSLRWTVPVVFLETSHVSQFSAELREEWIDVPWMNEFDEVLNKIKNNKPVEWKNFLRISWEFEDSFPVIENVISEMMGI